jgi:serine-type D-Ala-D-Ala carboxypeptidase
LYMKWHDAGWIDLDRNYPEKNFTFRHLLNHSSGLPAWKPFYESMISRFGNAGNMVNVPIETRKDFFYEMVISDSCISNPGEKILYSDLGFLLLSRFAEQKTSKSFDQLIQEEVWDSIKNCQLEFRPVFQKRRNEPGFAATEWCPWRGLLQGEVHDDNAWSMGGVAGHAGVFGSLNDILSWVSSFIRGEIASFRTMKEFSKIISDDFGTRRALGFDVPPLDGTGSTGDLFSTSATIGHLGFTGTSLWMDLDQGKFAVLLTNRVHPMRDDLRIRSFRKSFHHTAFAL